MYSIGLSGILYLLPYSFQLVIAFLLILSIGLLHGANDIKIIEQLKQSDSKSKIKWTIAYALLVLLTLVLFFLMPFIILPSFIIVSAYHFGEQHFEEFFETKSNTNILRYFLFFSYGIYIFFLLFYIDYNNTQLVVNDISNFWFSKLQILYITLTSFLFCIISLFLNAKDNFVFKQILANEILYLCVYLIIFCFSNLIVSFAIYFVFWHSLPSLSNQQDFLYSKTGFKGIVLYFIDSWKYWLISIIGLVIFWMFLKEDKNLYSVFFAFVAAITFPHVVVMHRMFSRKNRFPKNNY